jgi:phosphoglycolate phosphatase
MKATVILFDIDGTLVSCGGAGRRAMEAAFRELWHRDDVFDFAFGGGTDRAIARRAITSAGISPIESTIDRFLGCYLEHLPRTLDSSESYRVLPGASSLLDLLERQSGLAIGLGTGNVERGARAKLARGGLDRRFSFGGFGCDHEDRGRLLERGAQRGAKKLGAARADCDVIVIGDTPRDIEAARAIGARCVAVATGGHSAEELREAGAHLVCSELGALDDLSFLK